MTFTITLTELLVAVLIVAAIVVLIKLAQVLSALIPTLKSLQNITADAEDLTSFAKEKAEGLDEVLDDAKVGVASMAKAIKGEQNIIMSVGNIANAATSIMGVMKKNKDEED